MSSVTSVQKAWNLAILYRQLALAEARGQAVANEPEPLNPKVPIKVRREARADRDGIDCLPQLPAYQTPGSAGMDVHAFIPEAVDGWRLLGDRICLIPTGLFIEIPEGFEIQLRSRSGLSNLGINVAGGVRTIDSDFRGELLVPLNQTGTYPPYTVKNGDRIAQLVLSPAPQARWVIASKLSETERGTGGFGSTGSR